MRVVFFSDHDECSDNSYDCSAHLMCINTVGSYECNCNTGFIVDGTTCVGMCAFPLLTPLT